VARSALRFHVNDLRLRHNACVGVQAQFIKWQGSFVRTCRRLKWQFDKGLLPESVRCNCVPSSNILPTLLTANGCMPVTSNTKV
jgi:hypothetical protein